MTKIFDSETDNDKNDNGNNKPVLENPGQGAVAFLNRDKNGDAYISVKLPLGLGGVNLFPASGEMEHALNQLASYLED